MIESPSLVPDIEDMVSDAALSAAIATIASLVEYDHELEKWFVANDRLPIYRAVPGLLQLTQNQANALNQKRDMSNLRAGRDFGHLIERDNKMADEFIRLEPLKAAQLERFSFYSLCEEIGKQNGLSRNAAADAIKRGLKRRRRFDLLPSPRRRLCK